MISKNTVFKFVCLVVVTIGILGCNEKNAEPKLELANKEITLFYDQAYQIELKRGEVTVPFNEVTRSSSDEFVGRINEDGLFEAAHIGEAVVTLTHGGDVVKLKVNVQPRQTFLKEPKLPFGGDKIAIKQFETRSLQIENAAELFFKGENADINSVIYQFNNNTYRSATVTFPNSSLLLSRIGEFYAERYTYVGQLNGFDSFVNKENTMTIMLKHTDASLSAVYSAGTPATSIVISN